MRVSRPAGLLLALLGAASSHSASGPAPDVEALRARVEAIRAGEALQARGETVAARQLLPAFYESRGFRAAWDDPARQAGLLRAIRDAERDGLDPQDYHLRALADAESSGEPDGIELEVLRTDALIRLGYNVLFGKVDPATLDADWNYERVIPGFDPVRALEEIVAAPDVAAEIERAKPTLPLYVGLRDALARYRALRDGGGWGRIPGGGALRPGESDGRVPALRRRLAAEGDGADPGADPGSTRYDEPLADAVRAFQRRHGLKDDAVIGARTLEELDVPVARRIDDLRVNLERGRWLLHDLGGTFVAVNVAGYRLYFVRDGALEWETRVQVGKPYRATPVFRSKITYLVFNPTWTVPPGILRNDILPAQRRDAGTLARKGLKVYDASGKEVAASSVNWSARSFPYTLRQDPGPTNALGRVKFMFPNAHSVYLHDTPSRNLFDSDDRAFSSGCIRVEDPLVLAERLLTGQPEGSRPEIDRMVAAGKTKTVTLREPVPVLLTYWTAWVDRDGVQFRRDVYGRDAKVLAALDAEFAFGSAAKRYRPSIAPRARPRASEVR